MMSSMPPAACIEYCCTDVRVVPADRAPGHEPDRAQLLVTMSDIVVGLFLSIFSAFMFAVSNMFIVRGMSSGHMSAGVLTTILFSSLVIFIVSLATGQFFDIWKLGIYPALLFMLAGVLNFILGRGLNYAGMILLGPSRGSSITSSQSLFAVFFGILLISEPLTLLAGAGVILAFFGTVLVTTGNDRGKKLDSRGLLFALLAAIFVGMSVVVIRAADLRSPLPVDGALIAYLTAGLFYFMLNLLRTGSLRGVIAGNRKAMLAVAGTASGLAQSSRFVALLVSPVVLVAPIITANPLFTMFLSYMTMRGRETLGLHLVFGAILIVVGVAVISYTLGI